MHVLRLENLRNFLPSKDSIVVLRLLQNYLSKNKQKPELSQAEAFLFP